MKLSKPEEEVLKLMSEGWDLCVSNSMEARKWLQKNGCGRGDETKRVANAIFYILREKKLIFNPEYGFPTLVYYLTTLGKEYLSNQVNKNEKI